MNLPDRADCAAGTAGRFDAVAGALDGGGWAAHLMLRDQLDATELVALLDNGYLPPEIGWTWAGNLRVEERVELLSAVASSPLAAGKGPDIAERLVVSAPDAADAAATIAHMPARWLTFPFLGSCRSRWGDDTAVWEACVAAGSVDIDALERLWRMPLPRSLAQRSLDMWDQQILHLIELASGEEAADEEAVEEAGQALLAALGTVVEDPETISSPSPGRLQVQARILQHRHRLPDWVWLAAVAQVTEQVVLEAGERDAGNGQRGRALVADEVARRSRWLQLGVQLQRRCVSRQARERVEQMWGPSVAELAGAARSPKPGAAAAGAPEPLGRALVELDELAAATERSHTGSGDTVATQLLAVLDRVDGSAGPQARPAKLGTLGVRLVQLLVLSGADDAQWEAVLSRAVRKTGSVAGVAVGLLGWEGRERLWSLADEASAAAGSERAWLPEPGNAANVSVSQLGTRVLFARDNAELLHSLLVERGLPDVAIADAYRLALSLLDDMPDDTVGHLVATAAAACGTPRALTS